MKNSGLLLDTHVWIWLAMGNTTLTPKNRKIIAKFSQARSLFISSISAWEISMLMKKKRITLTTPPLEWINKSISHTGIQCIDVSPDIAIESCNLPGKFHADPSDSLIVATARLNDFCLMTRDEKIIKYSQQHFLTTIKA